MANFKNEDPIIGSRLVINNQNKKIITCRCGSTVFTQTIDCLMCECGRFLTAEEVLKISDFTFTYKSVQISNAKSKA